MIQFREKSAGRAHARLSLLTYPVLMAADIVLHDAEEVPVGDDQRQHVELTKDVAARFNRRYGETFVLPRAVKPATAARVRYDPDGQPGVANLLDVLAACSGTAPDSLAGQFTGYGGLKEAVADAVVAELTPVQERYAELVADPATTMAILREGAERARARAVATVARAQAALGLVPA